MGIASLVLGILSTLFALTGVGFWYAMILGVIGIALGAVGKKNGASCATAGLVLSIIGASLGVVSYIACMETLNAIENAF